MPFCEMTRILRLNVGWDNFVFDGKASASASSHSGRNASRRSDERSAGGGGRVSGRGRDGPAPTSYRDEGRLERVRRGGIFLLTQNDDDQQGGQTNDETHLLFL